MPEIRVYLQLVLEERNWGSARFKHLDKMIFVEAE